MIHLDDTLAIAGGEPVRSAPFPPHTILGTEERREVEDVFDSAILSGFVARPGAHFLGGPKVRLLEEEFQRYFNVAHAISMNSATAGLHAALVGLGCGPGDEVIVTPYTMSASATAVLMCNAVPIFADVDPIYGNIVAAAVRNAITPRTRAIVVVHLFGHPAPMDELLAVAGEARLPIVEDCAQAPAAIFDGRLTGTIGSIGVFSFNQFKTISCGEGGVAITADRDLAERMQLVRNHGECIVADMRPDDVDIIGYNYRMTELNAAVALAQFRKLDRLTEHRIALAGYLTERLTGFPGLNLPRPATRCKHVYFLYPIRLDETIWNISRDLFVEAMNAEGIPCGAGYSKPLHLLPFYQAQGREAHPASCSFRCPRYLGGPDYGEGSFPVAERLYSKEIVTTLLCRYPLTNADMDSVCQAIEKLWKGRSQFAP
jgi:perosamine synthetase